MGNDRTDYNHNSKIQLFSNWYSYNSGSSNTEVTSSNRDVIFAQANGKGVTDSELTFEWSQPQTTYQSKRNGEILRAMFVLKICSYDTFVRNSMQVSSIQYFDSRGSRKDSSKYVRLIEQHSTKTQSSEKNL